VTARQRELEAVALVEQMSYRKAAARLGISPSALAGLVYRARHVKEDEAPRARPARVQDDRWDERKLTERWADRQRRKSP
jgi:transposase